MFCVDSCTSTPTRSVPGCHILSLEDWRNKAKMFSHLHPEDSKVTDLDYLLNVGRLDEATKVLTAISTKLGEAYHEEKSALTVGLIGI